MQCDRKSCDTIVLPKTGLVVFGLGWEESERKIGKTLISKQAGS